MISDIRPHGSHEKYRLVLDNDLAILSAARLCEVDCPLCSSSKSNLFIKGVGLLSQYHRCQHCDLVYLKLRPCDEEILKYYQHGASSSFFHEFILKPTEDIRKNTIFKDRYDLLLKYIISNDSSMLDLGASIGSFVALLRQNGHRAIGFELNQRAADLANVNNKIIYSNYLELKSEVISDSVDILTAWEVVAHYASLLEELKLAVSRLKKGGYFIFTTPNIHSLEYSLMKEAHPNFVFPFLQLFSTKTIIKLLDVLKLKLVTLSTPGQRDVLTLAEYYATKKEGLNDLFQEFFFATDEKTSDLRMQFQSFISKNGLSGHMLVVAQK